MSNTIENPVFYLVKNERFYFCNLNEPKTLFRIWGTIYKGILAK